MKTKFLKINTPCTENWENMKANEGGHYCTVCSKNVLDFSQLSQEELSEKLKAAKGNICARVTSRQLSLPLIDFEAQKNYKLPYSNIAAGLIIATALATTQAAQAQDVKPKIESVPTSKDASSECNNQTPKEQSIVKPIAMTVFKGKIMYDSLPVINAQVTFVCLKKIISIYTNETGEFSMEIPTALIDEDNVITVTYDKIKKEIYGKGFWGLEATDYILSKKEINEPYTIISEPIVLVVGGLGIHNNRDVVKPIIIRNGIKITNDEFNRIIINKDINYFWFYGKYAKAIYGKEVKDGLCVIKS